MKKNLFSIVPLIIIGSNIMCAQTGNVGINTANPPNTLTVNGNTSVDSAYTNIAAPTDGVIIEGNVGIGTTIPTAKLDVAGKIKVTDGTEGDGKVLTSDANGLASWQPISSSTIITGNYNEAQNFRFITPPGTTLFTPDCPITLNKGIYTLFYYAQFDYYQPGSTTAFRLIDPTNSSTLYYSFPGYINFDFITTSGAADFPSYPWAGSTNGAHLLPVITSFQVASKISQLAIVHQDNTVIYPRYWRINAYGRVSNIGPIVAVKM